MSFPALRHLAASLPLVCGCGLLGPALGQQSSVPDAHSQLLTLPDGSRIAAAFCELVDCGEVQPNWTAAFEDAASACLALPPGWRFELSSRAIEPRAGDSRLASGRLIHRDLPEGGLSCQFTLDLEWARISLALFVADEPLTACARAEQSKRLYYSMPALPDFLCALLAATHQLRVPEFALDSLVARTGETFGPAPNFRLEAGVTLAEAAASPSSDTRLHMDLFALEALPSRASQAPLREERDALRRVVGDAHLSPPQTTLSTKQAVAAALRIQRCASRLPGRTEVLTSYGEQDEWASFQELQTPGQWSSSFFCRLRPRGKDAPVEVELGQVRTSAAQASALLLAGQAFAARQGEQLAIASAFVALDPPPSSDLLVFVTTPAGSHYLTASRGHLLEIELPVDGAPARERVVPLRSVEVRKYGSEYGFHATTEDHGRFETVVEFRFCAVGVTWPPQAHYRGRSGQVFGGTAFTADRP